MPKADSIASVTVDIPNECCSSDGWAVAVFVALEEIDLGESIIMNELIHKNERILTEDFKKEIK